MSGPAAALPTTPRLAPGTPIVVFGDDWGRHVSTMQHLFRHLTPEHPVIWVNAIGHRLPSVSRQDLRRVVQKAGSLLRPRERGAAIDLTAAPRVIVHPRVLPWHHVAPVRALNARSLVDAIARALDEAKVTERPVLVTGSPPSVAVLGKLGERGSLYFCMDDFLHLPNVSPRMIAPLERELLERIDVLVATAQALVESKRPRSGRAYYLPQGVNYEHFASPQRLPDELARLPRPIIGFAGGLTTPVDLALVARLADENPTASVVLIGPVLVDVSAIRRANVHLLGAKPYAELPAYVQAFDVGIIPYVLNPHTIAVDPLKLLEYLAAGIPVVTTDLPEVRKYRHAVAIGAKHEEFVESVRVALGAPKDSAARQAVAREHRWERRADGLSRVLGELAARHPAG